MPPFVGRDLKELRALHSFLKNSPMMAHLAMMAPRLVELHRLLPLAADRRRT